MDLNLTQPQSDFFLSPDKYPLFVGGFGSGKSLTMIAGVIRDLYQYPGANIGCYAPTYDLLSLITEQYLQEMLTEMGAQYNFNKQSHIFRIAGLGKIICRSMSNPERIIGYQVFRSHVDELDTLDAEKAENIWNKIIARNRQTIHVYDEEGGKIPNPDWDPDFVDPELPQDEFITEMNRVSAYTTPEGYKFAYKRWVKEPAEGYKMYRAPTWSNPHIPADYIPSLRASYPAQLIEAYLNGEFVNLTSGAVYTKFDRELNGSSEVVKGNEPLNVGMDFNVQWGAAGIHVMRGGNPHCVDQIHKAYDTDAQILYLKEKYPNNPICVYPDATGKSRKSSNTTETDIKKLHLAGFRVKTEFSNPLIKDRVASVNGMICNGEDERRYFINVEKCPDIVAGFEQQVYDDNGMPDKSNNLDHGLDACGYYLHREFSIIKPVSKIHVAAGGY